MMRKLKNEQGAIFIILSIITICYAQAKIGTALNAAAKEISQYTYLYYALNGDGRLCGKV
jgi:hypothetical protein